MNDQPHYHPNPSYRPDLTPPPKRRVPWWAWILVGVFGLPALAVGGCTAIVAAGSLATEAADKAPVISTAAPEVPTSTYDPGIQTPPAEAPRPPKPVEQAPSYVPEDGTALVGKDVKPGTYQTRVVEGEFLSSCYWARLDRNGEILDNAISTSVGARMTVTVRKTDYALEVNCYGAVWKRVGP